MDAYIGKQKAGVHPEGLLQESPVDTVANFPPL